MRVLGTGNLPFTVVTEGKGAIAYQPASVTPAALSLLPSLTSQVSGQHTKLILSSVLGK